MLAPFQPRGEDDGYDKSGALLYTLSDDEIPPAPREFPFDRESMRSCASISADDALIAICTSTGVRIFSTATFAPTGYFIPTGTSPSACAFSPTPSPT